MEQEQIRLFRSGRICHVVVAVYFTKTVQFIQTQPCFCCLSMCVWFLMTVRGMNNTFCLFMGISYVIHFCCNGAPVPDWDFYIIP